MYLVCEGKFIYHSSKEQIHVGKNNFLKKKCRLDWLLAFTGQLKHKPNQSIVLQERWFQPLSLKCGKNLYKLYCEPYISLGRQIGFEKHLVVAHGRKYTTVETIVTRALTDVIQF
jgi:hypothetical protein